ncbi:class I SAM-dependent methyltransferase [Thermodesulfobacteriota bacterium]
MKKTSANEPFLGKRFKYNPNYINRSMSVAASEAKSRVRENIRSGKYKYENCGCYCGSEDAVLISEIDAYGNYYPLVLCKSCGIMRANPRWRKQDYVDFYMNEYRPLYGEKEKNNAEWNTLKLKEAKDVYNFITNHVTLPSNSVIFDIGCNKGIMLLPFRNAGSVVKGVDYGAENIEYGIEKMGLDLEVGGVETLRSFGKKADLIILNHVFEHFLNIDEELERIHKVLKTSGYIYISVPGTFWWIENRCRGNIMGLFQNAHTWQFSLETLKYVMECNGFKLLFGNDKILSIFKCSSAMPRTRDSRPKGEFDKAIKYLNHKEKKYLPKYLIIKIIEALGLRNRARKLLRM